jgi:60 kDa SS-A/Ro ribonucleoprotein
MRFNLQKKKRASADTINLAGGEAFAESAKLELASLMLTATLQGQYYRAADVTAARLKQLIAQIGDKKFVAKAAIYVRTQAGMRSVTHLAAGELAHAARVSRGLPRSTTCWFTGRTMRLKSWPITWPSMAGRSQTR